MNHDLWEENAKNNMTCSSLRESTGKVEVTYYAVNAVLREGLWIKMSGDLV